MTVQFSDNSTLQRNLAEQFQSVPDRTSIGNGAVLPLPVSSRAAKWFAVGVVAHAEQSFRYLVWKLTEERIAH